MTYALKVAKSRFLMTLPSSLTVALEAARNAGILRHHVFLLEGNADGCTSIQDLMERGRQYIPDPPFRIPGGKTNKDVCGYLNFSSGTTGLPKAVRVQCMHGGRMDADEFHFRSCSRITISLLSVIN